MLAAAKNPKRDGRLDRAGKAGGVHNLHAALCVYSMRHAVARRQVALRHAAF
jgi:hypothetical protein